MLFPYTPELPSDDENEDGGGKALEVLLRLDPEAVKTMYLVKGKERTELERRGYSGGGDEYTFTYHAEHGFPPGSRLVAETYGEMQTFDAPFTLENLPLPTLPP